MGRTVAIITIALALFIPISMSSCGDNAGETSSSVSEVSTVQHTTANDDKMALLAAETILRNAERAQEKYYRQYGVYASSVEKLRNINAKISTRLIVVSGNEGGYEMQVIASDSAHTALILRKDGTRIERVDSNGEHW